MRGYSFQAITCAICAKPLNLRADLCADENGKAVHEECYVRPLCLRRELITNTDRRTRTSAHECSLSFQRHDANLAPLVTIALENELWID